MPDKIQSQRTGWYFRSVIMALAAVAAVGAFLVWWLVDHEDNAISENPNGVLESGIAYIQKPFTVDAIAAKLRQVLDQE